MNLEFDDLEGLEFLSEEEDEVAETPKGAVEEEIAPPSHETNEKTHTQYKALFGVPLHIPGEDVDPFEEELNKSIAARIRSDYLLTAVPRKAYKWLEFKAGRTYDQILNFTGVQDIPQFDLNDSLKEAGVDTFDAKLFDGVTSQREFDYIKSEMDIEREDNEIFASEPLSAKIVAESIGLLMDGYVIGKIAKATKFTGAGIKAISNPKVASVISKISNKTLNAIYQETAIAGSYAAGKEYIRTESDMERFVENTVLGAGLSLFIRAFPKGVTKVKQFYKEMTSEKTLAESVSESTAKYLAEETAEAFPSLQQTTVQNLEQATKKSMALKAGETTVEWLASKSYLTRTHPYMMAYSKVPKIENMAARLFNFNEGAVKTAFENTYESRMQAFTEVNAGHFKETLDLFKKTEKEVKNVTGDSVRNWFGKAFYGGKEAVPHEVPYREEITAKAEIFRKEAEKINQEIAEVFGKTRKAQSGFLPANEVQNFNLSDLTKRVLSGDYGTTPTYLPRRYNTTAIINNRAEFESILRKGKLHEKAVKLHKEGKKAKEIALELHIYDKGSTIDSEVKDQVIDLLTAKNELGTVDLSKKLKKRTIKVDDQALSKFFTVDTFENINMSLRAQKNQLEFQRTLNEAGYKNWKAFKEDVMKDLKEDLSVKGLQNRKKYERLIDQAENIVMYRRTKTPGDLDTKVLEYLASANNFMYAHTLGTTFLNSISDMKKMVLDHGLKNFVPELAGSLVDSVNNGIRHIAHLPATQKRQALNKIITGIDSTHLSFLAKITPTEFDSVFGNVSSMGLSTKLAYYTGKLSHYTSKLSFMSWWDDLNKRMATSLELKSLAKANPELKQMIESGDVSKEIQHKVYRKTRQSTNMPNLADTPAYGYEGVGKLAAVFKSWVFANSSNYLYPILRGQHKFGKIAESLVFVLSTKMFSEYLKGIVNGTPFNLSDKEDMKKFTEKVFDETLDDIAGNITVYKGSINAIFSGIKNNNLAKQGLREFSPTLNYYANWVNGFAHIIGGCASNSHIRSVTPNLWYTKPILNKYLDRKRRYESEGW